MALKKFLSLLSLSFIIFACTSTQLNYQIYNDIDFQKFTELNKNKTHIVINLDQQKLIVKTPYSEKIYPISSSAYGI